MLEKLFSTFFIYSAIQYFFSTIFSNFLVTISYPLYKVKSFERKTQSTYIKYIECRSSGRKKQKTIGFRFFSRCFVHDVCPWWTFSGILSFYSFQFLFLILVLTKRLFFYRWKHDYQKRLFLMSIKLNPFISI